MRASVFCALGNLNGSAEKGGVAERQSKVERKASRSSGIRNAMAVPVMQYMMRQASLPRVVTVMLLHRYGFSY